MPVNDSNKQWFDNLKMIQAKMKDITHLIEDNLKDFSQQKLDLLSDDLDKGSLSQFCQNAHIGLVPNNIFDDSSKTFFLFLNEISFSIDESLLQLWYIVAASFNNKLLDITTNDFAGMTLNEGFGETSFPSNPAKSQLHVKMQGFVPKEFYNPNGSQIKDGTKKVVDLINNILN